MYRFIEADGREVELTTLEEFIAVVRNGTLSHDGMLFDPAANRWRPAGEVEAFKIARAASTHIVVGSAAATREATDLRQCSECRNDVDAFARYCPRCGVPLHEECHEPWQYRAGEHEHGPVPRQVLEALLATGDVPPETLVKGPKMLFWIAANTHPRFMHIFRIEARQAEICGSPDRGADGTQDLLGPATQVGHGHHPLGSATAEDDGYKTALKRLEAFIGVNWNEHYRAAFERILRRDRGIRDNVGWTWNWPAALVPTWWWYRRMYGLFFLFMLIYVVITAIDNAVAGSTDGGSPVALLFIGQIVVQGWLGDRALYSRASRMIAEPVDYSRLAAAGRPNRWAIWVPVSLVAIGVVLVLAIIAAES